MWVVNKNKITNLRGGTGGIGTGRRRVKTM